MKASWSPLLANEMSSIIGILQVRPKYGPFIPSEPKLFRLLTRTKLDQKECPVEL